jgi:hypothetical protein
VALIRVLEPAWTTSYIGPYLLEIVIDND